QSPQFASERGGHPRADATEPDAPVPQVEHPVPACPEATALQISDEVEDRNIEVLHDAREDERPEIRLVDVDADTPRTPRPRYAQRADAAGSRDVEYDARTLR